MAIVPLCLIFLTIFLPTHSVTAQRVNGSVPLGASLTATPDAKPWLSPSGDFAFGFQQLQGNDNSYLLSIWYDKIPDKTIVWYLKDGPLVPRGSRVELIDGRGLVLSDPRGTEVWTSFFISNLSDLSHGAMNDTGNFVLVGRDSSKMWESFNFPSDTILPTQVMAIDGVIDSRMSRTNFSNGRFQLRMLRDGNLVLNTVDRYSGSSGNSYYTSNTNDESNATNSGEELVFDATGYMYISLRNGERAEVLTPRDKIPSGDYYHRASLDSDGVFTQYYYPKKPASGNTTWDVLWYVPRDMCQNDDSRACGLNSVCSLDGGRPKCECPRGFALLDANDPNGDCRPNFVTPSCDEGYREEDVDFIELSNVDWPNFDYVSMSSATDENCKTYCLKDCFCGAAIYRDNQCWRKKLPLSNGRMDNSRNLKVYLKFLKNDRPDPQSRPSEFSNENKYQKSLILVGSALVFVTLVLIGVIFVGIYKIKKPGSGIPYANPSSNKAVDQTTLHRFTYQELVNATNGFHDELGQGAFGVVYKGVVGTTPVAVKKLHTVVEDAQKEFKTEVNAIARTHHKNLVNLVGYCDDNEHRLLVYEFMSNGTLASFLFGDTRPSWQLRSYIALGIAKGLSYLHEECTTQIIHCDIKPQNILIDEYCNPKIADFGLAKLLMINQSRTNTGIRGTKGYVAPEWFRNTPITVKVDVYSFGVLLLEIISSRKSVVFESDNEDMEVLTDLAWDCYQEGKLDAFVNNDLEALDDYKRLTRFLMVGVWCVQENPCLRPAMRKVIQMLEGAVEVTEPPCPFPFSVTS